MLKKGMISKEVALWQTFLGLEADGIFGEETEVATKKFQKNYSLREDGVVGVSTLEKAKLQGFKNPFSISEASINYYPPRPDFKSPNNDQREKLFGKFSFEPTGGGNVRITTPGWTDKNIIRVKIPQLIGKIGAPKDGVIQAHRLAADAIKGFFEDVEKAGLGDLILSWAGSFYPRFIRGSSTTLSNHSWGTAFDINAPENWLGAKPTPVGKKGSLLKLVPIANQWGFYWGGHYNGRLDGMHFELSVLGRRPIPIPDINENTDDLLEFLPPQNASSVNAPELALPPIIENPAKESGLIKDWFEETLGDSIPKPNIPLNNSVETVTNKIEDTIEKATDKIADKVDDGTDKIADKVDEVSKKTDEAIGKASDAVQQQIEDKPFIQYLPNIDNLKKWFYKAIGTSFVANIGVFFANLPTWQKYAVGIITLLLVFALIFIIIFHRVYIFDLIKEAMKARMDKTKNSPVPVMSDGTYSLEAQVPGSKTAMQELVGQNSQKS